MPSPIVGYSVRLCGAVTDCRIQFQTVVQSQIVRYSVRLMLSLTVGYVRLCDAVTDCRILSDGVMQSQIVQYSVRLMQSVSRSLSVGYSVRLCDAVTDLGYSVRLCGAVTDCRIHRQTPLCSH